VKGAVASSRAIAPGTAARGINPVLESLRPVEMESRPFMLQRRCYQKKQS